MSYTILIFVFKLFIFFIFILASKCFLRWFFWIFFRFFYNFVSSAFLIAKIFWFFQWKNTFFFLQSFNWIRFIWYTFLCTIFFGFREFFLICASTEKWCNNLGWRISHTVFITWEIFNSMREWCLSLFLNIIIYWNFRIIFIVWLFFN